MIIKNVVKCVLLVWFCFCILGYKLRFDIKDKILCYFVVKELVLNKWNIMVIFLDNGKWG